MFLRIVKNHICFKRRYDFLYNFLEKLFFSFLIFLLEVVGGSKLVGFSYFSGLSPL